MIGNFALDKRINDQRMTCSVFFLPRGKAMSKSRINLLSASISKKEGVEVLDKFDIKGPPTHIVVDATISSNDLSNSLGIQSFTGMAKLFEEVSFLLSLYFLLFQS